MVFAWDLPTGFCDLTSGLQECNTAVWQSLHVAYAINPFLHYRALTDYVRGTRSLEQPLWYTQYLMLFTVLCNS